MGTSGNSSEAVIMDRAVRLTPRSHYVPPAVKGYGELYEEISANRKLHEIRRLYGDEVEVYLAPSVSSQGGMTHEQLLQKVMVMKPTPPQILRLGYVDNPPWKSNPLSRPKPLRLKSLAGFILTFLAKFEKETPKAHMIYVVTKMCR